MVILEQLITLDKSRIIRYMGKARRYQMNHIEHCAEISLALNA